VSCYFVELGECLGVAEVRGRSAEVRMLVPDDLGFVLIGVTTPELLGLKAGPVTWK
jgi:hypothetical protein